MDCYNMHDVNIHNLRFTTQFNYIQCYKLISSHWNKQQPIGPGEEPTHKEMLNKMAETQMRLSSLRPQQGVLTASYLHNQVQ